MALGIPKSFGASRGSGLSGARTPPRPPPLRRRPAPLRSTRTAIPTSNNSATAIPTVAPTPPAPSNPSMTGGPSIGGIRGYANPNDTRSPEERVFALNTMMTNQATAMGSGPYGRATMTQSQADNAYTQGLDFYRQMGYPDDAAIALQQDAARFKIGLQEAMGMTQGGIMQADTADQLAKLGFDNQRRGIDRNRLLQQLGESDKDIGYANKDAMFADDRLYLANQNFSLDSKGFREGAGIKDRNTKSQAIPRDASTSEFTRLRVGDIQTELANQLAGVDLGRQGAALTNAESKADIAKRKDDIARRKQDNKAALATLDTRAAEAGLDAATYRRKLDEGLKQLSLDTKLNVNDLMVAIQSGDIDRMMLAEQIIQKANGSIGYFAQNPVRRPTTPQPRPTSSAGSGSIKLQ